MRQSYKISQYFSLFRTSPPNLEMLPTCPHSSPLFGRRLCRKAASSLKRILRGVLVKLNGVLRHFQQYFSYITATAQIIHVFPVLHQYQAGLSSVSPEDTRGHSHEKNPEDPVRLEPRTPGLRVRHFTTEPSGTLRNGLKELRKSMSRFKSKSFRRT